MKESRFLELTGSLTDKEFKKFGEFLRSPYFNKSKTVITFYNYLQKIFPYLAKIDTAYLSQTIFGDAKKEDKILGLISEFSKLLEKFYVHTTIEENELYMNNILLRRFSDKNLPKNFETLNKKVYRTIPKDFDRDQDFYLNNMQIELSRFYFKLERNEEKLPDDVRKVSEYLDLYFIITKLNLFHFLNYYQKNNTKNETDLFFTDEVLKYIESNSKTLKSHHPMIYGSYLILMTITKPEEEVYFRKLKSFVFSNIENFSLANAEYFISGLMNYTVEKCNEGNSRFQFERFEIYRLSEKKFIFKRLSFINHIDFQNAISASLGVNNIKFAEEFLFKYKSKLIPEFKKDTISSVKAQILFAQKRYDEALNYTNKIDYLNSIFYLKAKVLQSKIYYMQKEINAQHYLIDTVKHYLKRNEDKMTKKNCEMYRKYFLYLQKMTNPNNLIKSKLIELRHDLEKESNIASKEWLLENLPK